MLARTPCVCKVCRNLRAMEGSCRVCGLLAGCSVLQGAGLSTGMWGLPQAGSVPNFLVWPIANERLNRPTKRHGVRENSLTREICMQWHESMDVLACVPEFCFFDIWPHRWPVKPIGRFKHILRARMHATNCSCRSVGNKKTREIFDLNITKLVHRYLICSHRYTARIY